MARYLSYEEYLARGGALGEAEFEACATRADGLVDALTHGRARSMRAVPEAVKAAMMSAVGVYVACGAGAVAAASPLAGFTADGYSETYRGAGEHADAAEKALKREIEALLAGETDDAGVPLLYAGVDCL